MASTEITTTTNALTVGTGRTVVRAGARLYWVGADLTDLVYYYSDTDGASWTGRTVINADDFRAVSAVYDAVNDRLNIVSAGGNNSATSLILRAITSNVTSGTPGALTAETVIDAGGASVGFSYPEIIHSATGTNPRYWIIGQKWTSAVLIETRVWYCAAGSDADTAGNWQNPAAWQDLGANVDAVGRHMGSGVWWTVGTGPPLDKVTFVFKTNTTGSFESVTFDPTDAVPTPGVVTAVASGYGNLDFNTNGSPVTLNAQPDYLVFGALDLDDNMWDFYKTVDGTTWSNPSGWLNLTMGRASLTKSGANFFIVHSDSYGVAASTSQTLSYRTITTAGDVMSGATVFSDTNGNTVTTPLDTGTDRLRAVYRGSTASPYTVRSDGVPLAVIAWVVA